MTPDDLLITVRRQISLAHPLAVQPVVSAILLLLSSCPNHFLSTQQKLGNHWKRIFCITPHWVEVKVAVGPIHHSNDQLWNTSLHITLVPLGSSQYPTYKPISISNSEATGLIASCNDNDTVANKYSILKHTQTLTWRLFLLLWLDFWVDVHRVSLPEQERLDMRPKFLETTVFRQDIRRIGLVINVEEWQNLCCNGFSDTVIG